MNKWTRSGTLATFLFFMPGSGNGASEGPRAEWESRFGNITGQVRAFYETPKLKSGISGQTFAYGFSEPGSNQPGIARFDADLSMPTWSAVSPFIEDAPSSAPELIPLADGSVIFLTDTLSRFAADGSVVWSMPKGELAAVAVLPSGDLVSVFRGEPGSIRVLSGATGATLDLLAIEGCQDAITASASGMVYVGGSCVPGRVTALRTDPLHVEWNSAPDELWHGQSVGMVADASGVLIAKSEQLRRLSASDGQLLWEAMPVEGQFKQFEIDGVGNIVTSGAAIDRWDGTTGTHLWHYAEAAVAHVDSAHDAVFFAGMRSPQSPGDRTRGYAGRLALADGNVVWRHETDGTASIQFFDIAMSAGDLRIVGVDCTFPYSETCRSLLWTADPATGNNLASAPLVARSGVRGTATLEEGDRTLLAALEWSADGPQIHLRSHDNATGALLQESVTPISFVTMAWSQNHSLSVVRSGDGNIVATFGIRGEGSTDYHVDATILKIDVTNGQRLWQKFLLDTVTSPQLNVYISEPAANAEGDIAIGVLDTYWEFLPSRRWVRKFSHATGELMWQREMPVNPLSISSYMAPGVSGLGEDFRSETPLGESIAAVTTLSGVDGTTRWANPLIVGQIRILDASTAIAWASGPEVVVRKFDIASGEILWTSSYSDPADVSYSMAGTAIGDEDDFYVGGTSRLVSPTTRGLLLRIGLATGNRVWARRLSENPVDPRSRVNPRIVQDGKIYATQPLRHTYGYALSAFSVVDGASRGSAYLYSSPLAHPHLPQHGDSGIIGATTAGDLLVIGALHEPGRATEWTLANWGLPMPGANGSLRVALALEPGDAAANEVRYDFVFETVNDGSVTADDVRALLTLPPGTLVESTSCVLAGMPCAAATTATSVEGSYMIAAGETLRISGSTRSIGTHDPLNPQEFIASAFAAHPFSELDLKDNVVSRGAVDRIFRNGFEP